VGLNGRCPSPKSPLALTSKRPRPSATTTNAFYSFRRCKRTRNYLDFLYGNKLEITPANVATILAIRDFYQIEGAKGIALQRLRVLFSKESLLQFLKECVDYNATKFGSSWLFFSRRTSTPSPARKFTP
jgi:hypothetical protein